MFYNESIGDYCQFIVRIIAKSRLRESWEKHPDAKGPLRAWYSEVERAEWQTSGHVRDQYRSASIVGDDRVVFNIKGNRYRLVVWINYRKGVVYIKWFGTHAEYDRVDVEKVGL